MPDDRRKEGDQDHRVNAPPDTITDFTSTLAGDQQALFTETAAEFEAGRDHAAAEERNRQWAAQIPDITPLGAQQLWIVGAAHISGLVLRFEDLGWSAVHETPETLFPPVTTGDDGAGPSGRQPDDID